MAGTGEMVYVKDELSLVLHCAINSEFSTTYLPQCFVVISQRWVHIASFFRLALAQIFGTEIHCYMRNAVLGKFGLG